MNVFIAGATGVLGRRIVRRLADRGHTATGLARDDRGAEGVRRAGGDPVIADLFDVDALTRSAAGADVVIHAATAIPTRNARRRSAWRMNDRVRRDGTRALAAAAVRVGARLYLQQSVVWVIRRPAAGMYDEDTPPNPTALLRSAVDGEEIARGAGEQSGMAVGVLRCGSFYAADAPHTRMMAELLRRRRLPIIGSGAARVAPLHADDAAAAFVAAAESGQAGCWHIVDDAPLPFEDYLRTFADALGAPAPRRVPVWLARALAGSALVDAMTSSMHTSNARARRELGWAPLYPTFMDGLRSVIMTWHEHNASAGRAAAPWPVEPRSSPRA
jgi:nucleoside-diphosphate-sugar epimerase